MKTRIVGESSSQERILIASQGTEFKNAVTESIATEFGKDGVCVEIVDVSNLSAVKTGTYSVFVIMNDYTWFSMDGDVKDFLESIKEHERKKLVLLITAGTPSSIDDDLQVDAVTCESEPSDIQSVSEKVKDRIRSVLAASRD